MTFLFRSMRKHAILPLSGRTYLRTHNDTILRTKERGNYLCVTFAYRKIKILDKLRLSLHALGPETIEIVGLETRELQKYKERSVTNFIGKCGSNNLCVTRPRDSTKRFARLFIRIILLFRAFRIVNSLQDLNVVHARRFKQHHFCTRSWSNVYSNLVLR